MTKCKNREIDVSEFGEIVSETRDAVIAHLHGHYDVALNEDEFLRLDDALVDLLRTFFVVDFPDRKTPN